MTKDEYIIKKLYYCNSILICESNLSVIENDELRLFFINRKMELETGLEQLEYQFKVVPIMWIYNQMHKRK